MTFDIETIETGGRSVTPTVREQAEPFGAIPEWGDFDERNRPARFEDWPARRAAR